jgi:hypothetical protein
MMMTCQHTDTYIIYKIRVDGSRELLRVCKDCKHQTKMDDLVG